MVQKVLGHCWGAQELVEMGSRWFKGFWVPLGGLRNLLRWVLGGSRDSGSLLGNQDQHKTFGWVLEQPTNPTQKLLVGSRSPLAASKASQAAF